MSIHFQGTPHVFFAAGFLGLSFCLPVYPLFLFGQLLPLLCMSVALVFGLGLASGLGCRVVALVWFGRAILFYLMCLGCFVSLCSFGLLFLVCWGIRWGIVLIEEGGMLMYERNRLTFI